jgi:hypothetical protein
LLLYVPDRPCGCLILGMAGAPFAEPGRLPDPLAEIYDNIEFP